MSDEPLGFFITWTVYGTFLPGDSRGWTRFGKGKQLPRPFLADWAKEQLKHPIELLNEADRTSAKLAIEKTGEERGWKIWKANPRSNHVHVVVSAPGYAGNVVRDQLKARCTRELRLHSPRFRDRTVWTRGGDWQIIDTEEELEAIILYAGEVQDRKDRD
jgi:REP element-mobilizing transposase RayT